MAKLTTSARNSLPSSAFADPAHRKYPVFDEGHRQAALGRAAQWAGPKLRKKVQAKVQTSRGYGGKPMEVDEDV